MHYPLPVVYSYIGHRRCAKAGWLLTVDQTGYVSVHPTLRRPNLIPTVIENPLYFHSVNVRIDLALATLELVRRSLCVGSFDTETRVMWIVL